MNPPERVRRCLTHHSCGSTGIAARREGRHYLGIELSRAYARLSERRIAEYYKRPQAPAGGTAQPSLFAEVDA